MEIKYLVEVNYGDNNFNILQLKRINELAEDISKHPFPGDFNNNLRGFDVSYEHVNESAIEQLGEEGLDLKYRRINIKKPKKNLTIFVLEDWIGSLTKNSADKKKILWGRREYSVLGF